jgi:O-antigen ligase
VRDECLGSSNLGQGYENEDARSLQHDVRDTRVARKGIDMRLRPATPGASAVLDDALRAEGATRRLVTQGLVGTASALALVALAVAMTVALEERPPSATVLVVFGIGVLGSLALAAVRYDALVALGVLLLAIVQFEPAPSDFIFTVAIAIALVSGRVVDPRIPPTVVLLAAFFVVLNLLSAVEVIDAARASFYVSITIYLLAFALWLATYVDCTRRATLIAGTYVAAATVSALLSSLALFASFPGDQLLVYDGERAQGLFKDPVVFASYLVFPALIMAERVVAPRAGRFRRLLAGAVFLTLVVGILFAYSRGAWLSLAVGLLVLGAVMFVRKGGARRMLSLVAVLLVVGTAAFATIEITGSEEVVAQRAQVQRYDEQRFGAQLFGIDQSARYPLGIGPGQFEVLSPVSAHSIYVRTLAEQGLLGLLTLLALLLLTLALAVGNAVASRDTYGIGSAALLGAWCGLLVDSLFVDTLHWRHLWLVAALIWAASARHVTTRAISPAR